MSRTPEEALRALTRPGLESVTIRQMGVSAVNDDGTVNLTLGNQVITAVPALASYVPRSEGDTVAVAQTGAGWLVLGRAGPEPGEPEPPRWGEVTGKPQIVSLDFGESGPPGGGWSKAAGVYVKDGQVWVDTTPASGGGGGSSPPRPAAVPDPRTVTPNTDAAFRFGSLTDSGNPIQGAWPTSSYPAYSGAWYYGTAIKDACDAGTVDYIEMRLTRSARYHGNPRGVTPHLYLHGQGSRHNAPPPTWSEWDAPPLELGQARTFRLPAGWVTQLKNGTAFGIACSAPKGPDYLIFGSTGTLTVHFK